MQDEGENKKRPHGFEYLMTKNDYSMIFNDYSMTNPV